MTWAAIDISPLLPWPLLTIVAAVTLFIVLLGFAARARGATLRAVAAGLFLIALLNPALVEEDREPLKDVAAIVVDETLSVSLANRNEQIEAAIEEIERQLAPLGDALETRVVRVRHATINDGGEGTKLIGPLERALRDVPAGRIAGAVLLTDGQVHDIPKSLEAPGVPRPLHVLLAGQPNEGDRRLVVVQAPSYGIVGKEISITVRVEDYGSGNAPGSGAPAQLSVQQDGGEPEEHLVPVGVDHTLTFTLRHGGPSVFELAVAPGKEELTLANNRAVISVNGVRDRLRVLLVSGEPHSGERTWRNLLKSDPSVDLVHFTILRPPEKQDGTPINELSLISFPTRELFEVKLDEFDLVIFDRYRRRGVLPPLYLQNIVDYIERGGAFLAAVGPDFATSYSIYRTPLGRALPGEPTGGIVTRGFRPELTEAGRRHPVTAELPAGPEFHADGQPQWGRWFRQIEVVKSRGRALMQGTDDFPLLLLDRYVDGRVAQFNSDHIWLWARGFEGGGPQGELLRRLAHWLMKEPELEENALRAAVVDGTLVVSRRSVDEIEPEAEIAGPDDAVEHLKLTETKPGRYEGKLPVTKAGLYTVREGDLVAMAVAGPLNPLELADVRATDEKLRPLAEATGGSIRWLADGVPDIRRVGPRHTKSGRNWIGLVANEDYVVTGARRLPALPPLMMLALILAAASVAWRREGG